MSHLPQWVQRVFLLAGVVEFPLVFFGGIVDYWQVWKVMLHVLMAAMDGDDGDDGDEMISIKASESEH